jgi:hypothetical protein
MIRYLYTLTTLLGSESKKHYSLETVLSELIYGFEVPEKCLSKLTLLLNSLQDLLS